MKSPVRRAAPLWVRHTQLEGRLAGPALAFPDIGPSYHPDYYTAVFISQHKRLLEPGLKYLPDYPSAQSCPRDKVKDAQASTGISHYPNIPRSANEEPLENTPRVCYALQAAFAPILLCRTAIARHLPSDGDSQ